MNRRRVAAIVVLLVAPATLVLAASTAFEYFPRDLIGLASVALAVVAGSYGLLHRGPARAVGVAAGALALAGAGVLALVDGGALEAVLIVAGLLLSLAAPQAAFRLHVPLAPVAAPRRPVLFFNPKSGGGKAQRFSLAAEARARGIQPIELRPGSDLDTLVREAVADGADALAMAGGDGSQATVGALDAFVDGGEQRADLAEVNGRVFVNNVSLGYTPRRCRVPATVTPRSKRCSTPCPTCSTPATRGSTCAGRTPVGKSNVRRGRSSCPTTVTGSAAWARALARGSTAACSVSRW
jgi:hypothetical protein